MSLRLVVNVGSVSHWRCTLPCTARFGHKLASATLVPSWATSMSYIAARIAGCSLRLIAIASSRERGSNRSIDAGGTSRPGGAPMTWAYSAWLIASPTSTALRSASPRLRLCHVGRRHVAALQTFLGGFERLAQKRHVDALRLHQALVGEHVGIGGHGVEQHALAGVAQRFASREHLRLRLAHGIGGPEAVEQDLRHREPDAPGAQRRSLNGVVGK